MRRMPGAKRSLSVEGKREVTLVQWKYQDLRLAHRNRPLKAETTVQSGTGYPRYCDFALCASSLRD